MKRRQEPTWLLPEMIIALQESLIAQLGGVAGVRDTTTLASALERPRNVFLYERPTLFALAAAYGLARNHAFVDGNKRISFLAATIFLELNGMTCRATEPDAVIKTLGLAAGEISELDYANWLKSVCVRSDALRN